MQSDDPDDPFNLVLIVNQVKSSIRATRPHGDHPYPDVWLYTPARVIVLNFSFTSFYSSLCLLM